MFVDPLTIEELVSTSLPATIKTHPTLGFEASCMKPVIYPPLYFLPITEVSPKLNAVVKGVSQRSGVAVGVTVFVGVTVPVGVLVGLIVRVTVAVGVRVRVGVGVGVRGSHKVTVAPLVITK